MHWFDVLFSEIADYLKEKDSVNCSAGLSVSGLQHVGRLRGEVVLTNAVAEELRKLGKKVKQYLVLYTQDPWKGTDRQKSQFSGMEGEDYVNWRLIDVPDPHGCHDGWVDHYWSDFGDFLESFAKGVRIVKTSDIYADNSMRRMVLDLVSKSEDVRTIVNKYRGRHKYPQGWIPFDAYCEGCRTIGRAETLGIDGDGMVHYKCPCGHKGKTDMREGKLNWRLEWPALWSALSVDFEAFGKDHATPGGSRDSCKDIAINVMKIRPPYGLPYEWVGLSRNGKDLGDMSSSSFLGFTPRKWLEIGEPEVLRYLYLYPRPSRRIVLDLSKVDVYHDRYDQAEVDFLSPSEEEESKLRSRSFELAQVKEPPERMHYQLAYRHAALLSQISPAGEGLQWALNRLIDTGILEREPSSIERKRIAARLSLAGSWVKDYGRRELRFELLRTPPKRVFSRLNENDKKALSMLAEELSGVEWSEGSIKECMVSLTESGNLPVNTRRFFRVFYLVFLGKEKGPRAAPLLSLLEKNFVIRRLEEASRF